MRLFIGVPVPPSPRFAEVAADVKAEAHGARPAGGEPHVTLRFLGEMPDPRPASDALGVLRGRPAVPAVVEGVGAFPDAKRARVVWAGVRAPGIEAVAQAVEDATRGLGEPPERRRFVAHVTLARLHQPADLRSLADRHRDTLFSQGTLDRVVLYRSHTGPGGPRHERLHEAMLGGP